MAENILISLTVIIVLGIGAEWLGWRLHFPSLILFLAFGFICGPVTGLINTDALLGNLLSPVVSISVAIILFEGGLSLRIKELNIVGRAVRNLITIGVISSWIVITLAAYFILKLDLQISALLGAILVVTGPTAIGPLLRHMKLVGKVGSIVKWEGIMIAPVGAILAVLVFKTILLTGEFHETTSETIIDLVKTIAVGFFAGTIGATLIILFLKKNWLPDFLHNTFSLMMVVCIYTVSDILQSKAGLLSVTIMGIILANQTFANVKAIVKFKEDLRILLIPSIFILLAARLKTTDLDFINLESIAFVAAVLFIARPISVLLSTNKSGLNLKEKLFLSFLAPRGIVAAAVSSVFALYLTDVGFHQVEYLVPITFIVIICTVTFCGLLAYPLAKYLKLSDPNPQGILIVGCHSWAQAIAKILKTEGFSILMVDTNRENISSAKLSGLPAYHGNILSETIFDEIDLTGIGRLLALTFNDEVNTLAALHFSDIFGAKKIYQLPPSNLTVDKRSSMSKHLRGNFLFGESVNNLYVSQRIYAGATIKKTTLTKEFNYESFKAHYGQNAIPLFIIDSGKLEIFTTDKKLTPKAGQALITLVDPVK